MKQTDLEPGFLQAFRLFIVTRIVFWVIVGPILIVVRLAQGATITPDEIPSMTLVERLTLPNIGPILAFEILLLLLTLPQVRRRLDRFFLPVALLLGLVPLLVGYYWWPSENPLQTPFIIFFFLMLILIAWQYPFRYVVVYVAGLTLYQLWTSSLVTNLPLLFGVEWLIMQASMMLLVGYIVVQLISIQREQRAALAKAYEQQTAANRRLQQYAATVEELGISRERNRLARELHDTLAHSLSAVTVQLEAVRSLWPVNPEMARRMLDRADETARRGLTEARRALHDLRATPLEDLGLILALREMAETAAKRSGVALDLQLPERLVGTIPPLVEQGVYRIAQEMLENAVRHAEARSLLVRLEQRADGLALTVEDDGRGIDLATMKEPETEPRRRLGIRGMEERATLIGGELQITSQPDQGTRVYLTVPI